MNAPLDYETYRILMTGNILTPEDIAAEKALLTEGTHDDGNATCVRMRHRDRFAHNRNFGWLHYTGTHWEREGAEVAMGNAIIETLHARLRAAIDTGKADNYKHILEKCLPNTAREKAIMHRLTRTLYLTHETFAEADHLLNVRNGVIDLSTGDIFPHDPSQRFMTCVPVCYDPNADQSFWRKWLVEAVGEEAADWLQLAVGYSLTGSTKEEVLFYLYGPPRSGKGTFTETILTLLGSPLAEAIPFDLLTAPRDVDTQNFRLAPLRGTRFVTASESNPYERFNEAKLKSLTGGDSIQCAFKHHDSFTYRPRFKIWLSSNQPVNVDPDDTAAWSRLRVIEFPTSHLGEENKGLKEAMRSREVLEGVLAWAIQGAIRWYALGDAGLPPLKSGEEIKTSHRSDLDKVQAWLDERCESVAGTFVANATLYQDYKSWCEANGVEAKKQKGFSQSLLHRGFAAGRGTTGSRGYVGIKIKFLTV
jgi:putative DNA primase/helicase